MSQHNTGQRFDQSSDRHGDGNHGRESSAESEKKSNKNRKDIPRQVKQGATEAVNKVKQQASSVVDQQKDVAAQKLESVGKVIRQSAEGLNEGNVPAFASFMEQAADSIEGLAQSVREGDFRGMIDGVEDWARRHPAIFLGGSLVAGLLVARFLKSSREREFGAVNSDIDHLHESDEFESEFAGAGISQYGSRSASPGDITPGMTVPGTTPTGQVGPIEPSSSWEEQ